MKKFSAALVPLALFACSQPARQPDPNQPPPPRPPLEFELTLHAQEFKSGDPILVRMRLKNVSQDPVLVNAWLGVNRESVPREFREVIFTVVGPDGSILRFDPMIRRGASSEFKVLKPAEFVQSELQLNEAFNMMPAGTYKVRAMYENVQEPLTNPWGMPVWKGTLTSNELAVVVR